jgi:hypothetical protein
MEYKRLLEEADRVRWRISSIPWRDIDHLAATPSLLGLIRETVRAEFTTFSASQRLFDQFSDDVDFTQWVTMWQYEETRHPHVLIRWLNECGEEFPVATALEARATHPLPASRLATLTTNIISEMLASAQYMSLYAACSEPVLKIIAKNLAADEARHASGFFSYARLALHRAERPARERANALRVLYMWVRRSDAVKHPLALFRDRVRDAGELANVVLTAGSEVLRSRVCETIGRLVDVPLARADEVLDCLTSLTDRRTVE